MSEGRYDLSPYPIGRNPRRWIKHGPTYHGKIGWELEGSAWINWGMSPYPPDQGKAYIHPRQPKGQMQYALMNVRKARGQDPYTGEPDEPPEQAISDDEEEEEPLGAPLPGALLRRGALPRGLGSGPQAPERRESQAEFQAKRRRRLLQHIREARPNIHAAAAHRWVGDYLKRYTRGK